MSQAIDAIWENAGWRVTEYGLESKIHHSYNIAAQRLGEDAELGGWPMHMAEKPEKIVLFNEAWMEALKIHKGKYEDISLHDAELMCNEAEWKWNESRSDYDALVKWLEEHHPQKINDNFFVISAKDLEDFEKFKRARLN